MLHLKRKSKEGERRKDSRQRKEAKPRKQAGESRLLSEPAAIMAPRLMFILSVVALCVFGIIMVFSASSITAHNEFGDSMYYVKRQVLFLVAGIILCIIFSKLPYTFWSTPAVFVTFWFLTVGFLFLTAFGMGVSALGAERSIIIAGFALQPAEFAKITVLIAVASIIKMRMDGAIDGRRFVGVILVATIVPLILIYRQPDLGTAIILAIGFIAVALLAGISWRVVFAILGIVVLYVVFACITQPYHLQRIVSMFNPWLDPQGSGYQSIQSLYAFGSGGIFGTGLGLSRQKYLYLPYAHTDFIFAIVGEELGLLGAVCMVCLFGVFIYAGMRICRMAPDMFGCMLSGAFTVMIGFQACVNMACVTGIAPVTGKALPLISYGGSSMIATMIMIGIILSVSFRSKVGMSYERKRDNFLIIEGGANGAAQGTYKDDLGAGLAGGNVIGFDSARRKRRKEGEPQAQPSGQWTRDTGHVRGGQTGRMGNVRTGAGQQPRNPMPWESPDDDAAIDYRSAQNTGPKGYAGLDSRRNPNRNPDRRR